MFLKGEWAERDERIDVVNLVSPISSADEFEDPNTVKVVIDSSGYALYFSREPIPNAFLNIVGRHGWVAGGDLFQHSERIDDVFDNHL